MRRRVLSIMIGMVALGVFQVPQVMAAPRPPGGYTDHVPSAGGIRSAHDALHQAAPRILVGKSAGIDVSHWQGAITWSKVAGAGYGFVYAKATEGKTFNDPNYAANRSGAKAAGMLFGAYHFASPDTSANDAVLEADHFANVAGPVSGELKPVLDIESSGGLSTTALINWAQAWLDEARAKIGVRPVIYSGPYFWRTYMGDTTQFAAEGYKNLWIANWNVPAPDVPAQNWDGNGWSVWQYSDCGSVPGISGCVDLDSLKTRRLNRLLIP